jgi:hypothetical protein
MKSWRVSFTAGGASSPAAIEPAYASGDAAASALSLCPFPFVPLPFVLILAP